MKNTQSCRWKACFIFFFTLYSNDLLEDRNDKRHLLCYWPLGFLTIEIFFSQLCQFLVRHNNILQTCCFNAGVYFEGVGTLCFRGALLPDGDTVCPNSRICFWGSALVILNSFCHYEVKGWYFWPLRKRVGLQNFQGYQKYLLNF